MTPTEIHDWILANIPNKLIYRLGTENDEPILLEIDKGTHQYVRPTNREKAGNYDGREHRHRKQFVVWCTIREFAGVGKPSIPTFVINGTGDTWAEALEAFKVDMKSKLKRVR